MMVPDFGYPSNNGNNENAFMSGPYMDNGGMQNFGGPGQAGPRGRGRASLPPGSMNNLYAGPVQNEMWEMGSKCPMPSQPHLHPPPQYPYRQPGPYVIKLFTSVIYKGL
jgi:hypothetical protein